MFSIVTSLSVLEKLFQDIVWRKIFSRTSLFYVLKDKPIPDDLDSPLLTLDQNDKLDMTRQETIKSIIDGKVQDIQAFPNSLFILNVNESYAREIQQGYGVICLSANNPDPSILLTVDPSYRSLIEGDTDLSWNDVLEGLVLPRIPSNSVVINDRNLFANDYIDIKKDGSTAECLNGVENIREILKNVLPKQFKGTFHVFIICDKDSIKEVQHNLSFVTISNKLNKLKSTFAKEYDYNITLEIAAVSRSNQIFADTHNRRIFSNYYTIAPDHKFCAFNGRKASCTQDIHLMKLFSFGIYDKSDAPLKGHDYSIKVLKSCIQEWKLQSENRSVLSTYNFSRNGNSHAGILSFSNPLLK